MKTQHVQVAQDLIVVTRHVRRKKMKKLVKKIKKSRNVKVRLYENETAGNTCTNSSTCGGAGSNCTNKQTC